MKRLRDLWRRAGLYRQRYGWRQALSRAVRVWLWLPAVLPSRRRASADAAPGGLPFGVNIIGYISGLGSMGEVARLTAESLQTAGSPVALIDITLPDVPDRHDPGLALQTTNPYSVNIFAIPEPFPWQMIHQVLGPGFMDGRINISIVAWEFQVAPQSWDFSPFDEIWVPSAFSRDGARASSAVPFVSVPHPIRLRLPPPLTPLPSLASIPADATVFLFVFNYHPHSFGRKNPEGLIEAFRRAFSPADNAWLVIKSEFRASRAVQRDLMTRAAGLNVLIVDAWMTRDQIEALMARCDCYVSLHRAEGFGLTLAEAMSLAKPVIATAYSGNLEFMTPENSYLVDCELVPLGQAAVEGHFDSDWLWAEPDLDQAAAYMRRVYEGPEFARAVGLRGREAVQRTLSPEAIGRLMQQRLADLTASKELEEVAR